MRIEDVTERCKCLFCPDGFMFIDDLMAHYLKKHSGDAYIELGNIQYDKSNSKLLKSTEE